MLDLGRVCDSAAVTLNGRQLGLRIAAPYVFDISDSARPGENEVMVEVETNPARAGADRYGGIPGQEGFMAATYTVLEPMGLLGPVRVFSVE